MPPRFLHISDLHVGSREEPEIERALGPFVERTTPELIIVSGDLTHRGRTAEHDRAAAFLRALERPVLAVPGNHDIPRWPLGRLVRPYAEFERHWQTTEPVHRSPALVALGLNSVRPWRHQSGGLRASQLRRTVDLLAGAPGGALRVVVLHHHLLGAPWRSWKRPLARRMRVLATLVDAGAELILAGHVHQAAVSERRDFEVAAGDEHGVAVATAPGLGQPRPRRRGEARGFHLYEIFAASLRVETYAWQRGGWALTAERRFPRGRNDLTAAGDAR